ncbi:MAG: DUF4003 family protein [Eubacteriaceae bacterium]|nr:DUF4003 family protein [Eubacteriaceae bacterium]
MDLALTFDNIIAMRNSFSRPSYQITILASLLFSENNIAYDDAIMGASLGFIRSATGNTSQFRFASAPIIAAKMSLCRDGVEALYNADACYAHLKNISFPPTQSASALPICAWEIANNAPGENMQLVCERAKAFYSSLRNRHSTIVSALEAAIACWIGLLPIDISAGAAFTDITHSRIIRNQWFNNTALATASLALISGLEDCAERIEAMKSSLRLFDQYAKRDSMPYWGTSALLANDISQAAKDINELFNRLKELNGFKFVAPSHILSFASLIYCIGIDDGTYQRHMRMPPQIAYSLLQAAKACAYAYFIQLSW